MTSADVAVLGAGPAGLGAALRLAKAGRSVVVLERSDRVGGLTASHEVAGQRVDIGSHRLHPSIDPAILAELRTLLGDELQLRRRNGRIRLFDRWVGFPLAPKDLARSMPPSFLVRAGASAAAAAVRPRRDDTFADYVSTGLGRVMGEEFYFPYARKIWGVEPNRLSGAQARRRISADSPFRLLRKVIRPAAVSNGVPPGHFYYPAGGFGRISEALADAATHAGASVCLSSDVQRVRITASGADVVTNERTIDVGTVLSTVPVTALAHVLDPAPTQPTTRLAHRAMLVVYVVVATDRYTEYDAHYLPDASTPITRVSEPKNYRTATTRFPDPLGTTVLCAEIPCDPADAVWAMPDPDLGALVVDGLARQGLPRPTVLDTHVLRQRQAYPVYPVGYERDLEPLLADLEARSRLLSFGRQGLFAHDNTHHALAMAWAAADCVRHDGSVDDSGWADARSRFGGHVVED